MRQKPEPNEGALQKWVVYKTKAHTTRTAQMFQEIKMQEEKKDQAKKAIIEELKFCNKIQMHVKTKKKL